MKPTKALILFLAPLALAACSSDPEWADPEAHEKTMELQERYAPLLVGTWHVERIGEKQRYFEKLTFSDSRNDIVGSRGTFIHVEPDKYDFERGQEYRIVKELFKSKQSNPQCVYCYFIIE